MSKSGNLVTEIGLNCTPSTSEDMAPALEDGAELSQQNLQNSYSVDRSVTASVDDEVDCTVFKDFQIEFCDIGDAVMSFDLGGGRHWKKRVWPRKDYPRRLLRWNSNEEILSYLISFERHREWITQQVPQRSPSGTILFFDKRTTKKYRNDGYDWKTRTTTSKTVREDRMKLKVGGCQLLYGCYAHSASDSNFHRRTYWLLQNPNLVMVHYLDSDDYLSASDYKEKDFSIATLDPTLTPTDWSLMTISDCNLCALLDMTSDSDITRMLLSQLCSLLRSNLLPGSAIADIVTRNNNGLPVEMFEECRSKKQRPVPKREGSCDCERNRQLNDDGTSSMDTTPLLSVGTPGVASVPPHATPFNRAPIIAPAMPSSVATPTMPSGNVPAIGPAPPSSTSSPPILINDSMESLDALKVLSKSPHLIMSYHKEGSVSYILTLPAAGGGPLLLPRAPSSNGVVGLPRLPHPSLLPSPSGTTDSAGTNYSFSALSGFQKNHKSKKVQPKEISQHQRESILDRLQKAMSGLAQPSSFCSSGISTDNKGNGENKRSSVAGVVTSNGRDSQSNSYRSTASDSNNIVGGYGDTTSLMVTEGHGPSPILEGNLSADDRDLDPKLFEVPLSWLSLPDEHAQSTKASMEDVLTKPSAAAALYNQQEPPSNGSFDEHMALSSDAIRQPDYDVSFMDNYDLDPSCLKLDFDSNTWDEMLQQAQPIVEGTASDPNAAGSSLSGPVTAMESEQIYSQCDRTESHATSQSEGTSSFCVETPQLDLVSSLPSTPSSSTLTSVSPLSNTYVPTTSNSFPSPWTGVWPTASATSSPVKIDLPASAPSVAASLSPLTHTSLLHQHHTHQRHHSSPMETNPSPYPNDSELPQELRSLIFESSTTALPQLALPDHTPSPQSSSNNRHDSLPMPGPPPVSLSHTSSPSSQHFSQSSIPGYQYSLSPQQQQQQLNHTRDSLSSSYLPCDTHLEPSIRKTSNVSIYSEPPIGCDHTELGGFSPSTYDCTSSFHLSLPNLAAGEGPSSSSSSSSSFHHLQGSLTLPYADPSSSVNVNPIPGLASPSAGLLPGNPSTPNARSSISPSSLQGIPEEIQIRLQNALGENCMEFLKYRTVPSVPSSPSATSASSSTMSMHDVFEESPSVRELCEMLSESPNVQQADFSHMTLTDMEQYQLFHAAEIIQNAFRKYKSRRQLKSKEKTAALLIENCYKKYREAKERRDMAARRIQNQYRIYKHRTRDLDRAATFIQQMYRSKGVRSSHPYQRPLDPNSEPNSST